MHPTISIRPGDPFFLTLKDNMSPPPPYPNAILEEVEFEKFETLTIYFKEKNAGCGCSSVLIWYVQGPGVLSSALQIKRKSKRKMKPKEIAPNFLLSLSTIQWSVRARKIRSAIEKDLKCIYISKFVRKFVILHCILHTLIT